MLDKILIWLFVALIVLSSILAFFSQTIIFATIGAWLGIAVLLIMIVVDTNSIQKIINKI